MSFIVAAAILVAVAYGHHRHRETLARRERVTRRARLEAQYLEAECRWNEVKFSTHLYIP